MALESAGNLWFGNDNELGLTFWQSIDASVIPGIGATTMKYACARAHQGDDPNAWFKGSDDAIARLKSQAHWQTDVIAAWALGTGVDYWKTTRAVPL
jgi:undecaprenyl-diphosphatase